MQPQSIGWRDIVLAAIIFAVAAFARVVYVIPCIHDLHKPLPFQVQDAETAVTLDRAEDQTAAPVTDRDMLVDNVIKSNAFASHAPLATGVEDTAHVAPGYPWLVGALARWLDDPPAATQALLWTQCTLGALTAVFCLLFARLAFGSALAGFLAGLLAAFHPFWIVNAAEMQDGALASFLMAGCLFLGTFATQRGSPLASLLFGGSLAGMALVRAALLPFGFVACLWFMVRCRRLPRGWICALLAFLGFGNGLAPWTVRNWQVFDEVVPIADSTFVHLLMGNNAKANGGPQSDQAFANSIKPERLEALHARTDQAARYRLLAAEVWDSVRANPAKTLENRLRSGVCFVFGAHWLGDPTVSQSANGADMPAWIGESLTVALPGMLLAMLVLGLLGWRWSCGWNREANLASLAMIWIPLPYILSHAEHFSGPRLPLDGVLLCYMAFALTRMLAPGSGLPFRGRAADEP